MSDFEDFILKFGADTTDFDSKIDNVKKKLDEVSGSYIIDFDADSANSNLKHATEAMKKFNTETKAAGTSGKVLDTNTSKIKQNITNMVEKSERLNQALRNTNMAKTVNDITKDIKTSEYFKNAKQRSIGMRSLRAMPLGLNKDWGLMGKFKNKAIDLHAPQELIDWAEKHSGTPIDENMSPGEALARFQGKAKATTYSSVFEDVFGSLADNRAKAGIFQKVYVEAKEALGKYDNQLKRVALTMEELINLNKKYTNDQKLLWKEAPGGDKYKSYEDFLKYSEKNQKILEASMFRLKDKGMVNHRANEVETELATLNTRRKERLDSGEWTRDDEKYKRLVSRIQEYRRELFELQSYKANNFESYERANPLDLDLRHKVTGSGEMVTKESLGLKEVPEDLDAIKAKYNEIASAIERNITLIKVLERVQEGVSMNIKSIVKDLQKDLNVEGYESAELSKFNKMYNTLKAMFDRDNPARKLSNAFTRLGSRVKQQMISIIANAINPIYVIQRGVNLFLKNNIRYANTFKIVAFNAYRLIEPMVRNLVNWSLRMLQYLNIFTKTWAGVDLFDAAAYKSNEIKNNMKDITASFDELHPVGEDTSSLLSFGGLPKIDEILAKKLQKLADKLKPTARKIGKVLIDSFKRPIKTLLHGWLVLEVTKLLWTLGGKITLHLAGAVLKGLGKGIGSLFKTGGLGFGKFIKHLISVPTLGKAFGKGAMTSKATKLLSIFKAISGVALVTLGSFDGWLNSRKLAHSWQDLKTGEKALRSLKSAVDAVSVGFGAFLLTGNPAIGVLAGVTSGAINLAGALAKNQSGIKGVKEETESWLEISRQAKDVQLELRNSQLELKELEEEYMISGKELYESVKDGSLQYEQLSSSQMKVYNAYEKTLTLQDSLKTFMQEMEVASQRIKIAKASESGDWENCLKSIKRSLEEGTITNEQAVDLYERAWGEMSHKARRIFGDEIPEEIKKTWTDTRYMSAMDKWVQRVQTKWSGMIRWFAQHPIKAMAGVITQGVGAAGGAFGGMKLGAALGSTFGPAGTIIGGGAGLIAGGIGGNYVGGMINDSINGIEYNSNNHATYPTDEERRRRYGGGFRYDVGTNYVPNDQLAIVHRGEAIIPAEYNNGATQGKPYEPNNNDNLENVLYMLNDATERLTTAVNQGINVSGEFRQRGSDLFATVERARTQRGSATLNNPSFAR